MTQCLGVSKSEVWGVSTASTPPTGKSFRFVRSCVRAGGRATDQGKEVSSNPQLFHVPPGCPSLFPSVGGMFSLFPSVGGTFFVLFPFEKIELSPARELDV